ncbi:SAM-dependent methyltransferase [Actinoalloteichus hoggarensis]|uniref:S-adenosyl methyltransferase n=1 Tax=Actinoalloteichus hoggarensis TaxID=1470176 RepID=A0A221VZ70_9PSEU|nr:SAM-dependent methyltransferase [Actinoalloteichus hoggarensis]ASO18827.1 S-adenosyl methyltransferase [Actinoalloteichus hoggarensis]MBB5920062.1 SAM-dependent methyltransferase [Actinoalloteichus hoggarensis]
MTSLPAELSKVVDVEKPSAARVYDYYLGGNCNFAADRELAKKVAVALPGVNEVARINRAFLGRAVRYCVKAGIRQFLDIGSGVPTVGNVHEVAQQLEPSSRVVYVDNEPVAVAHSELILEDNDLAEVVHADLRDPRSVLESPHTRALIDFDQPVAVLMVALLHFIPDSDRPLDVIATYRDRLAPGSMLAISHVTDESLTEGMHRLVEYYASSANPVTMRKRPEVESLFSGLDLVEPGVVWAPEWQPEAPESVGPAPENSGIYAGVGLKS